MPRLGLAAAAGAAGAGRVAFPGKTGQTQLCSNVVATAAGVSPSGQCSFMPFDVGPNATSFDQLLISVSTAIVGGTYVCKAAAYPDDGSYAAPLLSGGPLVSGDLDLSATSVRTATVAWNSVPVGRYWLAFFYYASVAPTTNPQPFCVSSGLALPSSSSPGSTCRALILTGLTALPTSGTPAPSTLTTCASVGARVA